MSVEAEATWFVASTISVTGRMNVFMAIRQRHAVSATRKANAMTRTTCDDLRANCGPTPLCKTAVSGTNGVNRCQTEAIGEVIEAEGDKAGNT